MLKGKCGRGEVLQMGSGRREVRQKGSVAEGKRGSWKVRWKGSETKGSKAEGK